MPNYQRIVFKYNREIFEKSRFKVKSSRQKTMKNSCQDFAVLSNRLLGKGLILLSGIPLLTQSDMSPGVWHDLDSKCLKMFV